MHIPSRTVVPTIAALVALGMIALTILQTSSDAWSQVISSLTPTPTAAPPPDRYVVVLISDGARYDQWDLAHMPNLAALVKRGTTFTQASVGQLPSITETSHATLGTGVYPYRHSILGDSWRIPGQDKMTPNLLDSQLDRTGYIEGLIRQQKVPTISQIVHRKFPNGIVIATGGHKVYASTALGTDANVVAFGLKDAKGRFAPSGTPKQAPDSSILRQKSLALAEYPRAAGLEDNWATDLATRMALRYRPRLMMINFPEIDNAGHTYGTDPAVINPIMLALDKDIGQLVATYKQLGILSKTDFIVTSDHGMVSSTNTVDVTQIQSVIKSTGATYLSVGHGDYCPVYLDDPSKTPVVAQALAAANIPHVHAVYMKNAQGQYVLASSQARLLPDPGLENAYAHLLATYNNTSSADIVLLYDEDTITMTPGFLKVGRKGDHEGASWGAQHIGLFMAGPGIKSGHTSNYPAQLVDIPMTIAALFTAHPNHVDGVPLTDAMTRPYKWMVASSNAARPSRLTNVTALSKQGLLSQTSP